MDRNTTSYKMKDKLYFSDRWCWSILVALGYAPGKVEKRALWELLTGDQQDALRIIQKQVDKDFGKKKPA